MSRPRLRHSVLASLLALAAALAGCPSPVAMVPDAPFVIPDAGPPDAGPVAAWERSADFPMPIAYATATILASGSRRWLFVVGGADADRDSIDAMYSTIWRAEIMADGSLGPWELSGNVTLTVGGSPANLQLAQHGALRLVGEDLREGVAIAGGTSSAGPIPVVLAGYVSTDGVLGDWGAFSPLLGAGEAHVLASFDRFDAHALALVGGFGGDAMPTERVDIAPIEVGTMVPTFLAGPPLPAPRVAHRTVQVGITFYVTGGENAGGPIADVVRTDRDAGGTGMVTGWVTAGTLTSPPSDHAAFVVDGEIWVVGGIEGGRDGGLLSTRARHAPVEAGGALGAWVEAPGRALPVGLADSAVAVDGRTVYMVGGRSVGGLAASTTVLVGRF